MYAYDSPGRLRNPDTAAHNREAALELVIANQKAAVKTLELRLRAEKAACGLALSWLHNCERCCPVHQNCELCYEEMQAELDAARGAVLKGEGQ